MMTSNYWFGGAGAYQINQSLRFNSADSAYLNRTPGSAGNRKTWTWSGWVKRCTFGSVDNCLFSAYGNGTQSAGIYFSNDVQNDSLEVRFGPYSGGWQGYLVTAQVFRDPSAWYHIVFAADTTQATASDRLKLYINGSQVTTFNSSAYPSQNADGFLNQAQEHQIGRLQGNTYYHDGCLAEVNFIDNTALTPSSFGETDTITGAWIPKKYSGSYGTNGFYLKFESSGIGTDSSGNGNNWTASGFSTSGTGTDVMSDTPTTNWCTLNPLTTSGGTYKEGNLQVFGAAPDGTFLLKSGKWYFEATQQTASYTPRGPASMWTLIGFRSANLDAGLNGSTGLFDNGYFVDRPVSGTPSDLLGGNLSAGKVIGVALDIDANTYQFFVDNSSVKTGTLSATAGIGVFPLFYSADSSYAQYIINFGQTAFVYTPPTGFKALNTANLPEPTIKDGGKYFDTVLYTGNGGTQTLSSLNFSPDLVWIKSRSAAYNHQLTDSVRGTGKELQSDLTGSETSYGLVSALNSNGFTVFTNGTYLASNANGTTYAAWCWDAGGAGSTNTAGTITSTVSANASAGFSIVTYTGNGSSNQTVGHGLGVAPAMIILKDRDSNTTSNRWWVWHQKLTSGHNIYLDDTAASFAVSGTTSGGIGGSPTSTTFTLQNGASNNNNVNENGDRFVAYCFSEVAGYSKFGSYTGNGSSDGPFVYTGHRSRFILYKRSDVANDWYIMDTARDTYNVSGTRLFPNLSNAEYVYTTTDLIDVTSNGFKIRSSNAALNASGGTYIFMALAENPFGGANTAPANAR